MIVLGIETHDAASCPGRDPNVMRQMRDKLLPDNAARGGLKILGAYMNCPSPATPGTHQGYFLVDAPDPNVVASYFDPPCKVAVQQVWSIPEQIKQMMG